jgi:CRP/FNR family cyclic AMP-dependent transcriptional regulator
MAPGTAITDTTEVLKKCFLFQACDDAGRRRLTERAHRRSYAAGETIFTFGSPGQSMMAILSGKVRISRPTAKGKEVILGEIGPGQVIGEIALLDGGERSAHAAAITRSELLILERRDVIPFLEANPQLCFKLLELVCSRLRRSDERMSDIGFADLSVRLAKTLLLYSAASDAKGKPKLSLTQSQLAETIGSTREGVNRQLRKWLREGIVNMKAGWIIIEDADALAEFSDDQRDPTPA